MWWWLARMEGGIRLDCLAGPHGQKEAPVRALHQKRASEGSHGLCFLFLICRLSTVYLLASLALRSVISRWDGMGGLLRLHKPAVITVAAAIPDPAST